MQCTFAIYSQHELGLKLESIQNPDRRVCPTRAPKDKMNVSGKTLPQGQLQILATLVVTAGLALLTACQGVSAAGSPPPPAGQLSLGSQTLDFGSVAAGASKTMSVTATNAGTKSITVSSAAISTKYFALASPNLPLTLSAGQSANLGITFTPNAAGSFTASVVVGSDASNGDVNLSVSGTGVAGGQLSLNPTSEAFGSVTVGSKQSKTVTLTNTGGVSVDISQATVSGSGFQLSGITAPLTLNANQSTTLTVAFAPQTAGSVSGALTIASNGANPTLVMQLSGTGIAAGALGSNPTTLTFGNVVVGTQQSLSETVTNTGGTSITISQVSASGTGFGYSGISAPVTLAAGQSASFSVKFAPTSTGAVNGSITITSTASNPTLSIALSGTGTTAAGQLTVSPTTLNLGSVVVGTSGTASGSLTASGASVTVNGASTNNSVFNVGGLSLPVTIASGQTVPFTITFSPTVTGTAGATLTVTSNAQPTTATQALTGTGAPAPVHSVNLSWSASTSSNVSGYNVYRAVYSTSACGSYAKINAALNTGTLYTDSAVVDGTAYCYATTAVNTSNQESAYSNIVSNVQIPAP